MKINEENTACVLKELSVFWLQGWDAHFCSKCACREWYVSYSPPLGSATKRPQSAQRRAHVCQGGLPALQTLQVSDAANSHQNKRVPKSGWFCAAAAPSCFLGESNRERSPARALRWEMPFPRTRSGEEGEGTAVPPASWTRAGEQMHPCRPAWASSFVTIFKSKTRNAQLCQIFIAHIHNCHLHFSC